MPAVPMHSWECDETHYFAESEPEGEEVYGVEADLQAMLDAENADAAEGGRQARIAAGEEYVCVGCGCSDTRSCAGGCIWATENLCSRCAAPGRPIIV